MCQKIPYPLDKNGKREKPHLYLKNIEKVWSVFNQYNINDIILLDDSIMKMKNNPKHSYLIINEWNNHSIDDYKDLEKLLKL